jgi:hypothetical protein
MCAGRQRVRACGRLRRLSRRCCHRALVIHQPAGGVAQQLPQLVNVRVVASAAGGSVHDSACCAAGAAAPEVHSAVAGGVVRGKQQRCHDGHSAHA